MTLGERIKKVRKDYDLTQQAFADRIGIKQNSIALIESGKRNTSDQVIISICREFNIREEWLRDGSEPMKNESKDDELWRIVNSRGLDADDYAFISEFITLPADMRKAILSFMTNVSERIKGNYSKSAPDSVAEAEALYEKSLGLVPHRETIASNTTGGTEYNTKEA